jgi:quinol---cytochrome c reductase iron-sulfur subunit
MKRTERWVALLFVLATIAALALFVVYVRGGNTQAEGILLFVALGGVGGGMMIWAHELMPRIRDERHPRAHAETTEAEMQDAVEVVKAGVDEMRRRRFLSRLLIGAAGALGLAALIPIRSLGRAPHDSLLTTQWTPGARLVTVDGTPVTASTVEVDSFTTVFPEGYAGSADSQAVLIRVQPGSLQLPADRLAGAPNGLVVYSKICTHAGCPLGLYLAATHELR